MVQIHIASDRHSTKGKIVFFFQQKIVERFHRNKSKEANEDVAERVFLISDERINLTFHLEDNRVTASTREFIRPPHTTEKGGILTMTPDMTTTFQVSFIACAFLALYVPAVIPGQIYNNEMPHHWFLFMT